MHQLELGHSFGCENESERFQTAFYNVRNQWPSGLTSLQGALGNVPVDALEVDMSFALTGRFLFYSSPQKRDITAWMPVIVVGAFHNGKWSRHSDGPFGIYVVVEEFTLCFPATILDQNDAISVYLRDDDAISVLRFHVDRGYYFELLVHRDECHAPGFPGHPVGAMLEFLRQRRPNLRVHPADLETKILSNQEFFSAIHSFVRSLNSNP